MSRATRYVVIAAVLAAVLTLVPLATTPEPAAADVAWPNGFVDQQVLSGLTWPTNMVFAPNGDLYVAEKAGRILRYDGLSDPTPSVVWDNRARTHSYADRGLLGLEVDPAFTTGRPYLYALWTYNARLGQSHPAWPADSCTQASLVGCTVSAKLTRLTVGGAGGITAEQDLIWDWCAQFSSHTIGNLEWAPNGDLLASAGDGASFDVADYGNLGGNPCGDPANQGGTLRSQDLRTTGDPTGLSGTIIRVDPDTGVGSSTNPLAGSADVNNRRIVAYGARNPFRFAVRPGTNEIWFGDVGQNTWEEINRVVDMNAGPTNLGWPCYEGVGRYSMYDDLDLALCETLYTSGTATAPWLQYRHGSPVNGNDRCSTIGGSTSGIAFYPGGSYPDAYDGALFFADYTRFCVWVAFAGAGGVPDPSTVTSLLDYAERPVDLEIGPNNDLFYLDIVGGTVHRVVYQGGGVGNRPPVARPSASVRTGAAPLTVSFDGRTSSDPDGDAITHTWAFGDGTGASGAQATKTYTRPGSYTAALTVADGRGGTDTERIAITVGGAPAPVISSPATSLQWSVGDTVRFSGRATDPEDGVLPASRLRWALILHHCATLTSCHVHQLRTWTGVTSGSFVAPEHEYPVYLELRLTATDSDGISRTASRRINPRTAVLRLRTDPRGIRLNAGSYTFTTPADVTVVAGATVTVTAPSPTTLAGSSYGFARWSDGGARSHNVVVPAAGRTLTAAYNRLARPGAVYQIWRNRPGATLGSIPPGAAPSGTGVVTDLEVPPNRADGTGTRVRAELTPTVSGYYTFWLASDDEGALFLSPDSGHWGRALLATVNGAVGYRSFDAQPNQRSERVRLLAGTRYFIEAFSKEGGGDDHLSVAWSGPGIARQIVPGRVLRTTPAGCSGWCPGMIGSTLTTWSGYRGRTIAEIPTGTAPTAIQNAFSSFVSADRSVSGGMRTTAWLTVPTTGLYRVYLSSSAQGVVALAPNADPAGRRVLVRVGSAGTPSGSFNLASQRSREVRLERGVRYYLEAYTKEGLGADHLQVAMSGPGIRFVQPIDPRWLRPVPSSVGCRGWCPPA